MRAEEDKEEPLVVQLNLEELRTATDDFSKERIVGTGGFGKVYMSEGLASLSSILRQHGHSSDARVAIKRADAGLELQDVRSEVRILQVCEHKHLLPLYGYCLDAMAPCLVFPLMVGGSLQTRLDCKPCDVGYLVSMGHFSAAPKPLTWRQKLRTVSEALAALLYLHTRTPRVLHRDFKPANVLLDASLCAYLGDTGFAKAAHRSGEGSSSQQRRGESTHRVMGSPGYAHKDVLAGQYSETTEAFAVGVTLLVVLTRREPVDIEEGIEDLHDDQPFAEIPASQMVEEGAGWPEVVASAIKELYTGLCIVRKKHQLKLGDVQQKLRSLLQAAADGTGGDVEAGPQQLRAAPAAEAATAAAYIPTPLSVQVREMRQGADAHEGIKDNMLLAFRTLTPRLDAVYAARAGEAPHDFKERIDFWHRACGMSADLTARLHTLRIWANAARHHDEERWQREGPRSETEACQLVSAARASIAALERGTS